ncbi:MAG: glycoside hydrolase family protein, partial [Pleurocapsa sp.]
KQSTVSRNLNAGDFEGAASVFLLLNKANQGCKLGAMPGLSKRRIAEKNLFLTSSSANLAR